MNAILNPHVRVGKIARLPDNIRDELNCRLYANEMGLRLVDWLNGLPEVQAILARDFGGRPINAVNLTKWKLGGYREWMFRRELILAARGAKSSLSSRPPTEASDSQHGLPTMAAPADRAAIANPFCRVEAKSAGGAVLPKPPGEGGSNQNQTGNSKIKPKSGCGVPLKKRTSRCQLFL